MATIYLEDIYSKFEEITGGWITFLNKETGEFVTFPSWDNDYVDREEFDEEEMDKCHSSDVFVQLPEQGELRNYDIMWDFAANYSDEKIGNRLLKVLQRKSPFRNFKDTLLDYGIREEYFAFRSSALRRKADEWCSDNGIPAISRNEKDKQ